MALNFDNLFANNEKNEIDDLYKEYGLGLEKIKLKRADESRASTSDVADDAELFFPMEQNESYTFEIILMAGWTDTNSIRFTLVGPAGAVGAFGIENPYPVYYPGDRESFFYDSGRKLGEVLVFSDTENGGWTFVIKGAVLNGATPGNLMFQWALKNSDTEPTTVYAGSHIRYRKVV